MVKLSTSDRLPLHGGDKEDAVARFGAPPASGWLDLSTGINPNAYPVGEIESSAWSDLPDAGALRALEKAAGKAYRASSVAQTVVAPGTQALIQALPHVVPRGRVAVLGPTYSEHEIAWQAAGHTVDVVARPEDFGSADIIVLVNPNNPDGRRFTPEQVMALVKPGRLLVVDEAFVDTEPELSVVGSTGQPGLIVLRSFGKFFGLAGVRLGFAFCPSDIAIPLRDRQGPWAVSGPALEIGRRALEDVTWQKNTRVELAHMAGRLDSLWGFEGCELVGGTSLFRLVSTPRAREIYEHLGQAGILVRPFAGQPDWLRFGLPRDDQEFARLELALKYFY